MKWPRQQLGSCTTEKISLCVIQHHAIKACGRVMVGIIYFPAKTAVSGSEWLALRPGRSLYLRKESAGTQRNGGSFGPRTAWDSGGDQNLCFLASAAKYNRLWDIMQRIVVIPYRRFGTTYRSHIQGSRSPRRKIRICFPLQGGGKDTELWTQYTQLSCTQSCTESLVFLCKNICLWLRQHTFSLFPLFISIILKLPRRKSNKNKSLRCRTSHCRRAKSNKEMVEWVVS